METIRVGEDDNLLDISKTVCKTHKLNADQVKDIANKLKEAIQMSAIGMSDIYEKVLEENIDDNPDQSLLLMSANKLIKELKRKNASHAKQVCRENNYYSQHNPGVNPQNPSIIQPIKEKSKINLNNDLYARDMQRKIMWNAKQTRLGDEKKSKELEGITFEPELCRVSKIMSNYMPNMEIRMDEKAKKVQSKIAVLKETDLEKYRRQCPFKPKINQAYLYSIY